MIAGVDRDPQSILRTDDLRKDLVPNAPPPQVLPTMDAFFNSVANFVEALESGIDRDLVGNWGWRQRVDQINSVSKSLRKIRDEISAKDRAGLFAYADEVLNNGNRYRRAGYDPGRRADLDKIQKDMDGIHEILHKKFSDCARRIEQSISVVESQIEKYWRFLAKRDTVEEVFQTKLEEFEATVVGEKVDVRAALKEAKAQELRKAAYRQLAMEYEVVLKNFSRSVYFYPLVPQTFSREQRLSAHPWQPAAHHRGRLLSANARAGLLSCMRCSPALVAMSIRVSVGLVTSNPFGPK